MLDHLDSRALRRTDCYAQRFMKPGVYPYNVLPAFSACLEQDWPYSIKVSEQKKKTAMTQHNVTVRYGKGRFSVDQHELAIEAGDLVMWNCPNGAEFPYLVAGEKEFFASNRLVNECGYTHAFGSAGEYRWRDAFGSKAHGIVRVREFSCEAGASAREYMELLQKGTLVMIDGGVAKPSSVEILVGQTVFFAVTKGPGLSITDERLLTRLKTVA